MIDSQPDDSRMNDESYRAVLNKTRTPTSITVRCTPRVEKLDIGLDFMELRQILTVFIRATLFYSAVFSFDHVSVRPVGLSVTSQNSVKTTELIELIFGVKA